MLATPDTDPPSPNRDQRRCIMETLEERYDRENECYRGSDTDKTIAQMCGENIRPGWVAQLRRDFFGDGDGNEEDGSLTQDAEDLKAQIQVAEKNARSAYSAVTAVEGELKGLRVEITSAREIVAELEKTA